jgi:SAM-dependent methyltransferase
MRSAERDAFCGLDLSIAALQLARKRVDEANWVGGSALDLPFANDSFDAVVCLEVLEHLHDPELALLELTRVARSWLVLSVPNEPLFQGANLLRGKNLRRWGNDPGHVHHWSYFEFRSFVDPHLELVAAQAPFPCTVLLCRPPDGTLP